MKPHVVCWPLPDAVQDTAHTLAPALPLPPLLPPPVEAHPSFGASSWSHAGQKMSV